MLAEFLVPNGIRLAVTAKNWEQAIDAGGEPLLKAGLITPSYIEAIKKNHREMPYMVIAPSIMLAHARPECGAKGIGFSLVTLKNPIEFGSELNDPVRLVITFATPDAKSHVQMLEDLMGFLMNSDLEKFLACQTISEATKILRGED